MESLIKYQLVLSYQMVLNNIIKTINNELEKYFTDDIMKQLEEYKTRI